MEGTPAMNIGLRALRQGQVEISARAVCSSLLHCRENICGTRKIRQ